MKRMLFAAICGALMLAGCGPVSIADLPPAPAAAADRTVLDEQGALAVELAYKAARLAVETAVDAGVIKGQRATQFAALDNKAYAAVQAVRTAYRAGNAASYATALTEARSAVEQLLALAGR